MRCLSPNPKAIKAANKLADQIKEIHGDKIVLAPDAVYINANEKVALICTVCGHEWMSRPTSFMHRGSGCPVCALAKLQVRGERRCTRASEIEKRQAREMYAAGQTMADIARELGRDDKTIARWVIPGRAEKARQDNARRWSDPENRARYNDAKREYKQTPHGYAACKKGEHRRRARERGFLEIMEDGVTFLYMTPPDSKEEREARRAIAAEIRRKSEETGEQWSEDHILPLSLGGEDQCFNIIPMPLKENNRKNGRFRPEDQDLYRQRIYEMFAAS